MGHIPIFLPKFHPELNHIERFWSRVKYWLRTHCMYTLKGLKANLARAFSEDVVPLSTIRKHARLSWRWMDAYRRQWSPDLTSFAATRYHGHRGVPATMDALMENLRSKNQHAAVAKGKELIETHRNERTGNGDRFVSFDPSTVSPHRFIDLHVYKEFEDCGVCEGVIKSVDVEQGTGRVLFRIEYLDGDFEDLYYKEIVPHLKTERAFIHLYGDTVVTT